jgi:hypothetical protein
MNPRNHPMTSGLAITGSRRLIVVAIQSQLSWSHYKHAAAPSRFTLVDSGCTSSTFSSHIRLGHVGLGVAALINTAMARNAERRNPPKGPSSRSMACGSTTWRKEAAAGRAPPWQWVYGRGFCDHGVIDLFAKKYRVIAFDRPGFGIANVLATPSGPFGAG